MCYQGKWSAETIAEIQNKARPQSQKPSQLEQSTQNILPTNSIGLDFQCEPVYKEPQREGILPRIVEKYILNFLNCD